MRQNISFYRPVFSIRDLPVTGLPEICISGRSNAGKSSLINRLANRRNLARISRKPGKTRSLNFYSADTTCYLVDLPGYGYAKVPKSERSLFKELVNPYLHTRQQLRGVIQLLDSRHGPVSGDYMMLEWIKKWGGKALYVFTKADKLSSSRRSRLKRTYINEFGAENCVLFSARTCSGLDVIRLWIERTLGIEKDEI